VWPVKPGYSTATRLILSIGGAAALIFISAFSYNYLVSRRTVIAEVEERAKNLTLSISHQIEAVLRGVEGVPKAIASLMEIQSLSREGLVPLIEKSLIFNPDIFGIAIAHEPYAISPELKFCAPYGFRGKDGIEFNFLGTDSYNYFILDWYQISRETGRAHWSNPYYDEGGGEILMATYSVPFFSLRGEKRHLMGVATADISLEWLKELLDGVKVYRSGYAFIISQNGDFITHPADELVMRESLFSLSEALNDPEIRLVGRDMIRGEKGFAEVKDFLTGGNSYLYYAPVGSSGWSLGIIFPASELLADVVGLTRKLAAIGIAGLILMCVVIVLLARGITRPLRTLSDSTAGLGKGDFSVKAPETGASEIRHLARSFNALGRQLEEYIEKRDFIRDTFGRYVTAEVVKRLMESADGLALGGEKRELTIMMSDLRGFTALTSQMEPERVVLFLNRYLSRMIEILMDHRAVIDEIIGDGILAFFGAPEPMEDHALKAVSCALKMQLAMEEINTVNEREGLGHLEMGIAVNTGDVVVGNIGSERRTKYGVVGAQVNFTGRMESFTVGGQILISPSTFERLSGVIEPGEQLKVQMKGVPAPVTLYEVKGLGEPYNIRLARIDDELRHLSSPIKVNIYRIKDKVVSGTGESALVVAINPKSATLVCSGMLKLWEDLRVDAADEKDPGERRSLFVKVMAVKEVPGEKQEASVRFTWVAPAFYKTINEIMASQ